MGQCRFRGLAVAATLCAAVALPDLAAAHPLFERKGGSWCRIRLASGPVFKSVCEAQPLNPGSVIIEKEPYTYDPYGHDH